MSLKKKSIVVAIVAMLLCVAVYLNIVYNRDDTDTGAQDGDLDAYAEAEETGNLGDAQFVDGTGEPLDGVEVKTGEEYFAEAKLNRENARDAALELLQQTLSDTNATEEAKNKASDQISKLAEITMAEARIEGLVTAKGFEQCVAFIGDNSLSIVVTSPEGGLLAADVSKIKDIGITEADIAAETIKIIEVK